MIRLCLLICGIILLQGSHLSVAEDGRENTPDARWIVHPGMDTLPNQWLAFRTVVDRGRQPGREMIAKIATDSKYWLYINGDLVVFEGGLKRGPTPSDTYADLVDIGPYLKEGKNVIGVLVWFFGKHGFSHNSSGLPGLYFSAPSGEEMIASDASWRVIRHPSFGSTDEGPRPNFRLPESNIYYDAREDIGDWLAGGFDDSSWHPAREMGAPPVAPWNNLVARPIPLWKDFGVRRFTDDPGIILPFTTLSDTVIRVRLPYNAQVTPGFVLKAAAGRKIVIKTDNYHGGSAYNVRTDYITGEGIQEFETPGWMNGHYVHYEIPAGIEVIDLTFRETGYDTEFTGYFNSNDPFLDLLWKKSKRSLYINMRDTYMDCPDRERAQWWGDVTLQFEQSFYAFDRQSDHLARKGILELINWQRADSTIFSPVPGNYRNELPMQMLASAGRYGIWNYFLYSADTATIEAVYPGIRRYLHVWETSSDRLVVPRTVGWTWGDWGDNKDMTLLFNLWYSLALKGFENMAQLLGHTADARWAAETNRNLKDAFHNTYWKGNKYRSPGYDLETDDRPHALAVLAGVVPPENYSLIRDVLRKEYHASPYMEKYVLEALIKMGFVEDALERMKERYRPMVESELTTLWEGWGIGAEGFGGGSYNHGWSGGPLTLLSRYVAGLAPAGPGFSGILFQPHPGHLMHASANAQTRFGSIDVSFQRDAGTFIQEISSPEGLGLTVGVPLLNRTVKSVRADDMIIWENGKEKANPGIRFLYQKEDYLFFEMNSGNYRFRVEYVASE
jgi:alpha-L-rhamnosidase